METKIYTILKIGYEYDDETYHTGNYGESYEQPSKYYTDLEKAREIRNKLEIKEFKGLYLGHYMYDVEDYLDKTNTTINDFFDFLNQEFNLNVTVEDNSDITIPNNATDEQIEKLMKMITLRFYKIGELNYEE